MGNCKRYYYSNNNNPSRRRTIRTASTWPCGRSTTCGTPLPRATRPSKMGIRDSEQGVERQDALSHRRPETRAHHHLLGGSGCPYVATHQSFGFVVPGRYEKSDPRPVAAALVVLYDHLPANRPCPQYGCRTLGSHHGNEACESHS